jgi:hypothetical protein
MAKVIIFDFDGTANTAKGAETIDRWLAGGDIIHIVTARTRGMQEVYDFAERHGIVKSRVHQVKLGEKWKLVNRLGAEKLVDNNPDELELVRKNTNALAWSPERL